MPTEATPLAATPVNEKPMAALRDALASHTPLALAAGGGLIGLVFGVILQRTGFCAMGAVADWHNTGDTRRLRAWLLASALAILGTAMLAAAGVVALDKSMYLSAKLNWLANLSGGALFGVGMVLAGGCTSRNLVRAGSGDLRAGLNVVVVGIAAYITLSGVLAPARAALEAATAIDLARHGIVDQGLPSLAIRLGLSTPALAPLAVAASVAAAGLAWCLFLPAFRRSPRHILSGVGVAACIVAGWALTGLTYDELSPRPLPPVSLTFVRPAGDALDWLQRFTALGPPGFGAATVAGTLVGSFLAAVIAGRAKLQTYADAADTTRNLTGSALMGIGGVMALGCTIGQGVTGVSSLAAGSFLALAAIVAGARAALFAIERWS